MSNEDRIKDLHDAAAQARRLSASTLEKADSERLLAIADQFDNEARLVWQGCLAANDDDKEDNDEDDKTSKP